MTVGPKNFTCQDPPKFLRGEPFLDIWSTDPTSSRWRTCESAKSRARRPSSNSQTARHWGISTCCTLSGTLRLVSRSPWSSASSLDGWMAGQRKIMQNHEAALHPPRICEREPNTFLVLTSFQEAPWKYGGFKTHHRYNQDVGMISSAKKYEIIWHYDTTVNNRICCSHRMLHKSIMEHNWTWGLPLEVLWHQKSGALGVPCF